MEFNDLDLHLEVIWNHVIYFTFNSSWCFERHGHEQMVMRAMYFDVTVRHRTKVAIVSV